MANFINVKLKQTFIYSTMVRLSDQSCLKYQTVSVKLLLNNFQSLFQTCILNFLYDVYNRNILLTKPFNYYEAVENWKFRFLFSLKFIIHDKLRKD